MENKLGIVILNYRSSDLIEKLLKCFRNYDGKILIVDNSEKKDEKVRLNKIKKNNLNLDLEIIFVKNDGYYKGNYEGIKYLFEKYNYEKTLIMNPDVYFEDINFIIKKLTNYLKEDIFIVGPKIKVKNSKTMATPILEYNTIIEILFNCFFPISTIVKGFLIRFLSGKTKNVFSVEGSFYLVNNVKYLSIEKYFQNIFLYGEEIIFGIVSKIKKWKILYVSEVQIIHNHPHGQENKNLDKFYGESLLEICKLKNEKQYIVNILKLSYKYKVFLKEKLLKIKLKMR